MESLSPRALQGLECGLIVMFKLMPKQVTIKSIDESYTFIKFTGKVQTPWFGSSIGINTTWRFLLAPQDNIFFVVIDLLASSKELLNLVNQKVN